MSKKEVLKAEEAVEVMRTTGVPAQETEGAGVVMATEIIADLKVNDDSLLEFFYRFIARVLKNRGY